MATPSPYLTTDDLVLSVQRSTSLPITQQTLTSDDIIAFMDEEQKLTISDLIHTVREEFWVKYDDQPIQANVFNYDIPQRGLAGGLRDVVFVDASGNEIEVALLAPEQLKTPAYFAYRPAFLSQGYFVKDAQLVLWPQNYNNTAYTLRQKFERRPNTLTAVANCALIMSVDTLNNQVTVNTVPASWTSSTVFDIISNVPQFTSVADDVTITNINNVVITFTALPSGVSSGQYLCPAGMTCVPQIPLEAYTLLVALGSKRVAQALQNSNLFNICVKDADAKLIQVREMLTPRIEGQPRKLVNRNSVGRLGYPYFR